jgi:hypothetical protein
LCTGRGETSWSGICLAKPYDEEGWALFGNGFSTAAQFLFFNSWLATHCHALQTRAAKNKNARLMPGA